MSKASFNWADPLLLDTQLSEEERMVRDAAAEYAQGRLMPRIHDAYRNETQVFLLKLWVPKHP